MRLTYGHTKAASYIGLVTQAILNSLIPLLFVTFQRDFDISLAQLSFLIILNFGIQLTVDALSAKFVDKIGYRAGIILAHVCGTVGIAGFGIFPFLFADAYAGLLVAMCISAVGGGLIEVIVSPMVEALPGDKKAGDMALLHSFFCWGCAIVIALSTLYFHFAGLEKWYFLSVLWALVPLFNCFFLSKVPIEKLVEEHERTPLKKLFTKRLFWTFLILMLCAGAAEQAMSQWASLFAETGLQVSKTTGDLLGPFAFAILMGISRVLFGRKADTHLERTLLTGGILCLASYMLVIFAPHPLLSLIGCAMCGFFVGPMWPGTVSLSSRRFPAGGTAMFALLAMGGDMGCAAGPGLVGLVSNAFTSGAGDPAASVDTTELGLKAGLLAASVFAIVLVVGLAGVMRRRSKPARQRS